MLLHTFVIVWGWNPVLAGFGRGHLRRIEERDADTVQSLPSTPPGVLSAQDLLRQSGHCKFLRPSIPSSPHLPTDWEKRSQQDRQVVAPLSKWAESKKAWAFQVPRQYLPLASCCM